MPVLHDAWRLSRLIFVFPDEKQTAIFVYRGSSGRKIERFDATLRSKGKKTFGYKSRLRNDQNNFSLSLSFPLNEFFELLLDINCK